MAVQKGESKHTHTHNACIYIYIHMYPSIKQLAHFSEEFHKHLRKGFYVFPVFVMHRLVPQTPSNLLLFGEVLLG